MQNSDGDTLASDQSPSLFTPDMKQGMKEFAGEAIGFDSSISSGSGSSDASPKDGSDSSSSLSSDSDSDSYNSYSNERSDSIGDKMLKQEKVNTETGLLGMEEVSHISELKGVNANRKMGGNEELDVLLRRISDYDEKLRLSSQQLEFSEEEIKRLKSELKNNESELESVKNEIKMHKADVQIENSKVFDLQKEIAALEAELRSERSISKELKESIMQYEADISDRDHEIKVLSAALQDASEKFAVEKAELQSRILDLSQLLNLQEARSNDLEMQCKSLANEIEQCEARWQVDSDRLKEDLYGKNELVDTLSKQLDSLTCQYDMLTVEKDGANTKLEKLDGELCSRDNQIRQLEDHLHQLHSENVKLTAASETAGKLIEELRTKVDELEKELDRQKVMMSVRAEEKREAIRQLCYSLEYYRSVYEELRQASIRLKSPAVVVS